MDHNFVQSTEKGASATLRNVCQMCGKSREAHESSAHESSATSDLMKYKAVLTNVEGLERPNQCFAGHIDNLDNWMRGVLKKYPQGIIEVYESTQVLRHRVSARISETGGVVLDSKSLLDKGHLGS